MGRDTHAASTGRETHAGRFASTLVAPLVDNVYIVDYLVVDPDTDGLR